MALKRNQERLDGLGLEKQEETASRLHVNLGEPGTFLHFFHDSVHGSPFLVFTEEWTFPALNFYVAYIRAKKD